jgi:hypothetical protein
MAARLCDPRITAAAARRDRPTRAAFSLCSSRVGAQWLRTGFQTRVPRVRFLPPMLFPCPRTGNRRIDNWICHSQFPGPNQVREGRAVGQWQGHLIWDEGNGGSSPSSSTRRPQDASYRPSGRQQACPAPEIRSTSDAGCRTPVAQPERAPVYEAGGCRFKSCRACCVRSRSGRCTGTWPRRKRVRVPPDTPVQAALAQLEEAAGSGPEGSGFESLEPHGTDSSNHAHRRTGAPERTTRQTGVGHT